MAIADSTLNITVITDRDNGWLEQNFETPGSKKAIAQRAVDYLQRILSGNESAYVGTDTTSAPTIALSIQGNATRASGTILFSGPPNTGSTILINGVTFTSTASETPSTNQWTNGATAAESATNLAAAINASITALVVGYVTAVATSALVTVYSTTYGTAGNQITLAEGVDAGNVMTVSGPRLSGGAADATALTLTF